MWKCLTLTRASTEFIGQELQIVITTDALMISDNNIYMITSSYCCVFLMHEDITLCMYLTKYLQYLELIIVYKKFNSKEEKILC